MTFITGMKYNDGVVLIGDTKVLEGQTSHHTKKIVAPLQGTSVAVGSAGLTQLAKEFNIRINLQVIQRQAEYRLLNIKALKDTGMDIKEVEDGKVKDVALPFNYNYITFLDDCAVLTKQLADVGKVYSPNPIESLVALYNGQESILYKIDCNGFKIESPYTSIGRGADLIGDYLKENYKPNMTLYDAVLLGTFFIKFIEQSKFDVFKTVGLEKGKLPQIFVINKSECKEYNFSDQDKKSILKKAEKRVKTIHKEMRIFRVKNKTDSLISSIANGRII